MAKCCSIIRSSLKGFKFSNLQVIDWVSEAGEMIAPLPRSFVHKFNILHKGMGVLLFDRDEKIFVHQRASTKRIFPSLFDMFIGGVSASKELPMQTLIRELNEEAGKF